MQLQCSKTLLRFAPALNHEIRTWAFLDLACHTRRYFSQHLRLLRLLLVFRISLMGIIHLLAGTLQSWRISIQKPIIVSSRLNEILQIMLLIASEKQTSWKSFNMMESQPPDYSSWTLMCVDTDGSWRRLLIYKDRGNQKSLLVPFGIQWQALAPDWCGVWADQRQMMPTSRDSPLRPAFYRAAFSLKCFSEHAMPRDLIALPWN